MNLILAIDLMNGKVVKAFAGLRFNYKPLILKNKDFSDPFELIYKVKKKIHLKRVYIADLNSIMKLGSNSKLIDIILQNFPEINFLIDCGFDYPKNVYDFHINKKKKKIRNYKIVLGTETLRNFRIKSYDSLNNFDISLDFNGKEKLWIKKFRREKLNFSLILMFLKNVGGRGVNYRLVKKFVNAFPRRDIIVAGGLSSFGQTKQLSKIGVDSVISSTMIMEVVTRDNV